MMKAFSLVIVAAAMFAGPSPALALSARTFVSTAGDDGNPCTVTAPCRSFAAALAATAPDGEVDVLTPGGYGAFTVMHGVSIQGHDFAGVSIAGGNAITINAGATDSINLRGLLIDGGGRAGNGVSFTAGQELNIQDCLIRNFANTGSNGMGISFMPSDTSDLEVWNTVVSDNGGNGVLIQPSGTGSVTAALHALQTTNNQEDGLAVIGSNAAGGSIQVTVSESVIAHNTGDGVDVLSTTVPTVVMARRSTISDNATGLLTNGAAATLRLTRSSVTGNRTAGWSAANMATLLSYADNNIANNASANNAPPPLPLK